MTGQAIFTFIAKHPASMCVAGGILLLLLSPFYDDFWLGGWILVFIGVILNIMWLIITKRIF